MNVWMNVWINVWKLCTYVNNIGLTYGLVLWLSYCG